MTVTTTYMPSEISTVTATCRFNKKDFIVVDDFDNEGLCVEIREVRLKDDTREDNVLVVFLTNEDAREFFTSCLVALDQRGLSK